MSTKKDGNYHAYLLRFWRDDKVSPWRAMLIDPQTGQSFGFASLPQLYAFLDRQTAIDSDPDQEDKVR